MHQGSYRCVLTITHSKAQMFMQMEIFTDRNLYRLCWCVEGLGNQEKEQKGSEAEKENE